MRKTATQVVTVHDLSFYQEPAWYRFERAAYYRWAVARSLRHTARVIAVSRATARAVYERLGYPEDRIDVVPNGVDERFRPATAEEKESILSKYALPKRFFLYVGTLEPRKNLPRLIRAWSTVAGRCEQDLVLAGRHGWKHSPVLTEVRRSAHATRIHLPGFVEAEDLPALMSGADAFVYPSLYEGFGIPIAEAMACGTAVLTSSTTSLPEVAGDAALLVDPNDVAALGDAIARLAEDAHLRAELAAKGLARAARYSWKRTAELTLNVYRAALQG
jgi:glycosyltransferase involved in cell wall biosynthesis